MSRSGPLGAALVGRRLAVPPPHVEYATADTMRAFARAYGDGNPLFTDEAYGAASVRGAMVAPPLFALAAGVCDGGGRGGGSVPLHELVAGPHRVSSEHWRLLRPIRAGVRLQRVDVVRAVEARGRETDVVVRSTYRVGAIRYAVRDRTLAYGAPQAASGPASRPASRRGRRRYRAAELAAIASAQDGEVVRGGTALTIDQVRVGASLPTMVKGPMTLTDLIVYRAGAGGGPFGVAALGLARRAWQERPGAFSIDEWGVPETIERLHWDVAHARAAGHPGVVDYSHTRMNWVCHALTNWMGDGGWLESLDFALAGINAVGDTHWITGAVVAVRRGRGGGAATVALEARNQRGDTTATATAVVRLPLPGAVAYRPPEG